MIDLFSQVWPAMPKYVALTHEDIDHVAGNQLFPGAEIIAHRSMPERMKLAADPAESQHILHAVADPPTREVLKAVHPGLLAAGDQLAQTYNFDGIELVMPTILFDDRYVLDLDGTEVHLIYVGPAHQVGDVIVHVPSEGVLFAGDLLFYECTPMGWVGSYDQFFRGHRHDDRPEPLRHRPRAWPGLRDRGPPGRAGVLPARLRRSPGPASTRGSPPSRPPNGSSSGSYGQWKAPTRLALNVERAYREFRNEAPDAVWDKPAIFDSMYEVAITRGLPVEY